MSDLLLCCQNTVSWKSLCHTSYFANWQMLYYSIFPVMVVGCLLRLLPEVSLDTTLPQRSEVPGRRTATWCLVSGPHTADASHISWHQTLYLTQLWRRSSLLSLLGLCWVFSSDGVRAWAPNKSIEHWQFIPSWSSVCHCADCTTVFV